MFFVPYTINDLFPFFYLLTRTSFSLLFSSVLPPSSFLHLQSPPLDHSTLFKPLCNALRSVFHQRPFSVFSIYSSSCFFLNYLHLSFTFHLSFIQSLAPLPPIFPSFLLLLTFSPPYTSLPLHLFTQYLPHFPITSLQFPSTFHLSLSPNLFIDYLRSPLLFFPSSVPPSSTILFTYAYLPTLIVQSFHVGVPLPFSQLSLHHMS